MDTSEVDPNLEEINFPKMPWTVEQKEALENSQKALEKVFVYVRAYILLD